MEQTTDLHLAISLRNTDCSSSEGGTLIFDKALALDSPELALTSGKSNLWSRSVSGTVSFPLFLLQMDLGIENSK